MSKMPVSIHNLFDKVERALFQLRLQKSVKEWSNESFEFDIEKLVLQPYNDFVLISNNPNVLEAYNRMINNRNTDLQQ